MVYAYVYDSWILKLVMVIACYSIKRIILGMEIQGKY